MDVPECIPAKREKRRRVENIRFALVAERETVKESAQRYDYGAMAHCDAPSASSMISAWKAHQGSEALGQTSTAVEEQAHVALVKAADARKRGHWKKLKVFGPARTGNPSKVIADTRRAFS